MTNLNEIESSYIYDRQIIDNLSGEERSKLNNPIIIKDNIDIHPYLALYGLSYNKINTQFAFDSLIKGLDYFKSFCPRGLASIYSRILYYNYFNAEQIKKLTVKMFFYLFHNNLDISLTSTSSTGELIRQLANHVDDIKVKFIIWSFSKRLFNDKVRDLYSDLKKNLQQLNSFEREMIQQAKDEGEIK